MQTKTRKKRRSSPDSERRSRRQHNIPEADDEVFQQLLDLTATTKDHAWLTALDQVVKDPSSEAATKRLTQAVDDMKGETQLGTHTRVLGLVSKQKLYPLSVALMNRIYKHAVLQSSLLVFLLQLPLVHFQHVLRHMIGQQQEQQPVDVLYSTVVRDLFLHHPTLPTDDGRVVVTGLLRLSHLMVQCWAKTFELQLWRLLVVTNPEMLLAVEEEEEEEEEGKRALIPKTHLPALIETVWETAEKDSSLSTALNLCLVLLNNNNNNKVVRSLAPWTVRSIVWAWNSTGRPQKLNALIQAIEASIIEQHQKVHEKTGSFSSLYPLLFLLSWHGTSNPHRLWAALHIAMLNGDVDMVKLIVTRNLNTNKASCFLRPLPLTYQAAVHIPPIPAVTVLMETKTTTTQLQLQQKQRVGTEMMLTMLMVGWSTALACYAIRQQQPRLRALAAWLVEEWPGHWDKQVVDDFPLSLVTAGERDDVVMDWCLRNMGPRIAKSPPTLRRLAKWAVAREQSREVRERQALVSRMTLASADDASGPLLWLPAWWTNRQEQIVQWYCPLVAPDDQDALIQLVLPLFARLSSDEIGWVCDGQDGCEDWFALRFGRFGTKEEKKADMSLLDTVRQYLLHRQRGQEQTLRHRIQQTRPDPEFLEFVRPGGKAWDDPMWVQWMLESGVGDDAGASHSQQQLVTLRQLLTLESGTDYRCTTFLLGRGFGMALVQDKKLAEALLPAWTKLLLREQQQWKRCHNEDEEAAVDAFCMQLFQHLLQRVATTEETLVVDAMARFWRREQQQQLGPNLMQDALAMLMECLSRWTSQQAAKHASWFANWCKKVMRECDAKQANGLVDRLIERTWVTTLVHLFKDAGAGAAPAVAERVLVTLLEKKQAEQPDMDALLATCQLLCHDLVVDEQERACLLSRVLLSPPPPPPADPRWTRFWSEQVHTFVMAGGGAKSLLAELIHPATTYNWLVDKPHLYPSEMQIELRRFAAVEFFLRNREYASKIFPQGWNAGWTEEEGERIAKYLRQNGNVPINCAGQRTQLLDLVAPEVKLKLPDLSRSSFMQD